MCGEQQKYIKETIKFTATTKQGKKKVITFTSRKPIKKDEQDRLSELRKSAERRKYSGLFEKDGV